MIPIQQKLSHQLVQPHALPLGHACVHHFFQSGMSQPPALRLAWLRVAHDDLGVLELLQLLRGDLSVDHRELHQVEGVLEHRRVARQLAQPRGHGVQPRADNRLDRGRHPSRTLPVRAVP